MEAPKCINGQIAVNICVSDDCNHPNPFICVNCVKKSCQQLHEYCITPQWNKTKNIINKSKEINNVEFINICNAVQQTIKKAMKYLEKQLQYFYFWKSTFGMPVEAVTLFKCIQNNQEYKFTGKQMAQIIKDAKLEKQIYKFNETWTKQHMKNVFERMEQTQKMIRQMYSVQDDDFRNEILKAPQNNIQQRLSLKIKQSKLNSLNRRLRELKEKPTALELKWAIIFQIDQRDEHIVKREAYLQQLGEALKNSNLKSLNNIILYYPWTLGYDSDFIHAQQAISSSLLKLPQLLSVIIISNGVKSTEGFKILGNKVKVSNDEGWYNKQKWY